MAGGSLTVVVEGVEMPVLLPDGVPAVVEAGKLLLGVSTGAGAPGTAMGGVVGVIFFFGALSPKEKPPAAGVEVLEELGLLLTVLLLLAAPNANPVAVAACLSSSLGAAAGVPNPKDGATALGLVSPLGALPSGAGAPKPEKLTPPFDLVEESLPVLKSKAGRFALSAGGAKAVEFPKLNPPVVADLSVPLVSGVDTGAAKLNDVGAATGLDEELSWLLSPELNEKETAGVEVVDPLFATPNDGGPDDAGVEIPTPNIEGPGVGPGAEDPPPKLKDGAGVGAGPSPFPPPLLLLFVPKLKFIFYRYSAHYSIVELTVK
jgi:hypothetical protein